MNMAKSALSGLPTIHLLKGQIPHHILSNILEYTILRTQLHEIMINIGSVIVSNLFLAGEFLSHLSMLHDFNLP